MTLTLKVSLHQMKLDSRTDRRTDIQTEKTHDTGQEKINQCQI